jgi:N-acetylmuramoyl-L-alanine amidase
MSDPASEIHLNLLPYVQALQLREPAQVDLVVIHCTELPDLGMARSYGERALYPSGTGNSGHFYIDRDGRIECYVPAERIAHHVRGFNDRAIGIELVNRGRYPDWLHSRHQSMDEAYPRAQLQALVDLLAQLSAQWPALAWIAGHEDLDRERVPASDDPSVQVRRKLDPGPRFPWPWLLERTALARLPG